MIETLTWGQIIGASIVVAAVPAGFIIYALCRFSSQLSQEERFERQQQRVRERLNSVAGRNGHVRETEHGTARADLAAFAALLLSMALVGAAVWAASGWWG